MEKLTAKGYKINEKLATFLGKVDAILIQSDKKKENGADFRGDDKAVGFLVYYTKDNFSCNSNQK